MPIARQPNAEQGNAEKYGEWHNKFSLLSSILQLAVPLWIDQLKSAGWDYILQRAKVCSQIVAEKGDIILFKSSKKGESAAAFNALAEGIACIAFVPGGVNVFGDHWEACLHKDAPERTRMALVTLLDAFHKVLNSQ
jgi:hypothetical protein